MRFRMSSITCLYCIPIFYDQIIHPYKRWFMTIFYDPYIYYILIYIISDGSSMFIPSGRGSQRRAQGPRHWTTHGRIATTKSWSFWRPHLGSIDASTHCLGNRWQGLGSKNAQCHAVPWSSIILIHYHSLSFMIHNYCSHRSLWLQGWKLKMLEFAQNSSVRPLGFHCFGSSAACDWLIGLVCSKCEGSCLATLIELREQTRDWQLSCFRNGCKCRMLKVIPKIHRLS